MASGFSPHFKLGEFVELQLRGSRSEVVVGI